MQKLELPDRHLTLYRTPLRPKDPLRAWDAADEYLLRDFAEQGVEAERPRILLVNDAFGALGVALSEFGPTSWDDSWFAREALAHNLAENDLPSDAVTFIGGDATPQGTFDVVLMKLPKSLSWLEDQLLKLRACLHETSRVAAGGMIKHSPARAYKLLEDIIGPTRTSLGWKKSRLAHADFEADRDLPAAAPDTRYRLEGSDLVLSNDANLFSRERLDLGTRLLLGHVPRSEEPWKIADLGCGNGLLGLVAARRCPQAEVLFVDTSYQAVASARRNAAAAELAPPRLAFDVADGLSDTPPESLDLVLCNPPFHQAQSVDDWVAGRMIVQAHRALRPGGELRLVGNRHLGHHVKLKQLFGACDILESHPKYGVLRAVKT